MKPLHKTAAEYREMVTTKKRRHSGPTRFITPAEPRVVAPLCVEAELAIAVRSEPNMSSGHRIARWKRGKVQAEAVWYALLARTDVRDELEKITKAPHVVVTLTRIGPTKRDDDNEHAGWKAVRDAVARMLGIDDGDASIRFVYPEHEKSREHGARVRIEAGATV